MEFSLEQQRALTILPKPSAVVSFVASISLIYQLHHEKRKKPFHRIVLAMSCHSMIQSIVFVWGTHAFPVIDTIDIYGARGSFTTCKIQGILSYINLVPIALHYVSLATYSFVAIRNDFQQKKIAWIEKWMFLAVYTWTLSTAFWLAYSGMFNPSGAMCWIESFPQGCEKSTDVECVRGNAKGLTYNLVVVVGAFSIVVMGTTTVMMFSMYIVIRKREMEIQKLVGKARYRGLARAKKSFIVARQAGIYLASLYGAMTLAIATRLVEAVTGYLCFPLLAASATIMPLQGFFIFLVFHNFSRIRQANKQTSRRLSVEFSSKRSAKPKKDEGPDEANSLEEGFDPRSFTIFDGSGPVTGVWKDFIFEDDKSDIENV